jgi:hypothetical protein
MSELLSQFRAKYPQYEGVDDAKLADGIYNKHYAGKMDRVDFDLKVGGQQTRPDQPLVTAPQETPQSIPWSDVPGMAMDNFGSSAKQFGSDIVQPFISPVETAKSLGNLGLGIIQKVVPGEQESEKYADAVGEFFSNRYGGIEELKRTMATDPVGFLSDASTILTGGGMLAAKIPGTAGRVGKTIGTVGKVIDPVNAAIKGTGLATKLAGKVVPHGLGVMTGTGGAPISEAFNAGRKGGDAADAFKANIRGGASEAAAILTDAKSGLSKMRQNISKAYKDGMVDISNDATVLDFQQVNDALVDAITDNTFNGVPKSKGAAKALEEVTQEIQEWSMRDPAIFHTPEGMDALKQRIGDMMDWTNRGDKENRAIQSMYNSVKGVIENQAPAYGKIMRDYSEGSAQLRDLEKALSIGNKAAADTALRKLTSVMRNNVNTNYGNRVAGVEALQTASGKPLMPAIAGQAMNAPTPRGLAQLGTHATMTGLAGALLTPWAAASLPLQSPRIVGEGAYYAGAGARGADMAGALLGKAGITSRGAGAASFQAGRTKEEIQRQNMIDAMQGAR